MEPAATAASRSRILVYLLLGLCLHFRGSWAKTFSSRLIHRFSDEARAASGVSLQGVGDWPRRGSMEYYGALVRNDVHRLRSSKLGQGGRYDVLFPSEGSETAALGNDFGWLHYTWIDIGTPNVSFLVALDAGSDLLWLPCDCLQCAPLSGRYNSLDKDLSMYNPAESSSSKNLYCSHELCSLGPNCESPKQTCPYRVSYYSENTTSSGILIEDTLYLTSSNSHASKSSVQASVILGCGRKQSGGCLEGIAPDGLMGLGFGNISVPSVLAKVGLIRNSFSMCFGEDNSGTILFGDDGTANQQSTPFLTYDGRYLTYIVEVERFCIGTTCLGQTGFEALVDSGSSFTFLPDGVYKRVTAEFDKRMNASRSVYDGYPWEYCYKASSLEMPDIPKVTIMLSMNKTFVVNNPIFNYYGKEGDLAGFCLALQTSGENVGTIGHNFMMGYRMVFDRENLKLGWSRSNCNELDNSTRVPVTPPAQDRPENPLPTEQQNSPGKAVSPAVAGRAPHNHSFAPPRLAVCLSPWMYLLLLLLAFSVISAG
ncbi:Aspartic proteinase-like protein 1 [Acorus gramineus]|uniref:Aspartic proteinase-like protein 1 n=1 Tax=Acorus gramineus TaxID=55184 RepID=A0AAV9BMF5_ACOGR|nr:Aspartic proteinase-like protein 1 [Acorus gramineus]